LATASGRGAIAVLHDTTDLERLEQVRKDFVANVSNEMRTPIAAIAGYAETLLDGLSTIRRITGSLSRSSSPAIRLQQYRFRSAGAVRLEAESIPAGPAGSRCRLPSRMRSLPWKLKHGREV
jgi:signal transduction histidine kinase